MKRDAKSTDQDLVAACLDGSNAAWRQLVDRYGRLVYSIPRRYGFQDMDADDITQRVFLIAFRKLESLRDVARLSSWLITATHRECWRAGRQRDGRAAPVEAIDAPIVDPESAASWERQHLVREGLTELGGRCQELLSALFYEAGESDYVSIASRLGMPVGSIGPTRARCFEKLASILERLGLDPDDVR